MVAADLLDIEGNLDRDLRDLIINQAFSRGLLLIGCGQAAIRFCPPLVIDRDQIQIALQIISDLLA
jgi:4-aminobutyrate aminotransferase